MKNKLNVIASVLALLIFGNIAMAQLPLNTGFNHDVQDKYSIGVADDFWIVVYDPVAGTGEPRSSNNINKHAAWSLPIGQYSQWISYSLNGMPGVNGNYVYQKCFCLKPGFEKFPDLAVFNVSVRADDGFKLYLNQPLNNIVADTAPVLLASSTSGGYYNSPNSAQLTLRGREIIRNLRAGSNCVQVKVTDTGGAITGFNLDGSISAAGIDGIAKGANRQTQYNSCSSCRQQKITEVTDDIKVKNNN